MNPSFLILEKILNNKYRAIHHFFFTGLILIFWFLFTINPLNKFHDLIKTFFYATTYILIAYLNIYVLFTNFLLKGKITFYILSSLLSFAFSYVLQQFIYFKDWDTFNKDLSFSIRSFSDFAINIITYCMFIALGLSVKVIKLLISSEGRIQLLERENLKAELSSLKNQLNPHFLFNTFNNLYVLSKTNPKIASEMILGFSDLMRYQLNESDKDKVRIENEINYIKNFLDLEKLRKDNLRISFEYNPYNLNGLFIEPLLFVTLIENAVKHGSQKMEQAYIDVKIELIEQTLCFEIENSKPELEVIDQQFNSGKGLENLKKRLSLSYPLKHQLYLNNEKNRFKAKLLIQLA